MDSAVLERLRDLQLWRELAAAKYGVLVDRNRRRPQLDVLWVIIAMQATTALVGTLLALRRPRVLARLWG